MTHRSDRQSCGNFGPPVRGRRDWLRRAGTGFGALALTSLLADDNCLFAADGRRVKPSHAKQTAKNVILLFMGGGPSHVDTFDPKPTLARLQGKDVPESIARGVPRIARSRLKNCFACPYTFRRYGQSGLPVSDLFRQTAEFMDDICVIRSMHHRTPVHAPAEYFVTTGSLTGTRPSLGAWVSYGLGTENRNLPGFVVLLAGSSLGGNPCWGSGFLPTQYQGTVVDAKAGVPDTVMPKGFSRKHRRAQLDLLAALNRRQLDRLGANSELEARIHSYELAFRMQTAAPEAFDLAFESAETKHLYGLDRKVCAEYGRNCLLARRLVERGVRFVQVNQGGWDAHGNLKRNHDGQAAKVDRPIAGLLADLKRRGLFDDTLIIWAGEFGRTPTAENQSKTPGRDHSPSGFTVWLAGAGVAGGQAIGATDPIGYTAVETPVHPNDLHATILHALGIDQHDLYYNHNNRKELLTVNGGKVVNQVFA